MGAPHSDITDLSDALAGYGLLLRGGFNFGASEHDAPLIGGRPAKAVLLVGQAGISAWPHFQAWRKRQPADLANPLDTWSRVVTAAIAAAFGARVVSPSDKPYLPFQQWAMRAEGLRPSPLGILMHPTYGLWHAYRAALLFDRALPLPSPTTAVHLCDSCAGKPCLDACPVGAYSLDGFEHGACRSFLQSKAPSSCMTAGCLARRACPHGAAFRYGDGQHSFHMRSFSAP